MRKNINLLSIVFLSFLALLTSCKTKRDNTHTHNFIKGEVVEATCTTDGYTVYNCSCGETKKSDIVEKLGHSYGEFVVTVEPTSTTSGVREKVCTRCSDKITETIDPIEEGHVHSYTEYKLVITPTLESEGLISSNCKDLDSSITKVLPKLGDLSYTLTSNSKSATCASRGFNEYQIALSSLGLDTTDTLTFSVETQRLEHELVETKKDATCVEYGYIKETCKNCDYDCTTIINPLGHDWVRNGALCEANTVCSRCNEIGELKHNHSLSEVITNATCASEGKIDYTCDYCNKVIATTILPKLDHTLGDYTKVGEAKIDQNNQCLSYQTYEATCSVCNEVVNTCETIYSHKYNKTVIKDATCQEEGLLELKCSVCGETETKTIEINSEAHNYESKGVSDNVETYECTYCHNTLSVLSNKNSDSATISKTSLETTQSIELKDGIISLSDETIESLPDSVEISIENVSIDSLSLTDEQKAQIGNNTIYDFNLTDGTNKVTFAGTVRVRIPYTLGVNETGNDLVIWYVSQDGNVEAINASYVNGYVEFNTTHFSYYTVAKLSASQKCQNVNHTYVKGTAYEATCTQNGHINYVCIDCGDTYSKTIEALGHDVVINTKDATCTENGLITKTCDRCDYKQEILIKAHDHEFVVDQSSLVLPTCKSSGHMVYKCKYCNLTYNSTMTQLSHDFKTTIFSPTCLAIGYSKHVCKTCGEIIYDTYVSETGHNYVDTIVSPTCTTDGYTLHKCSNCDSEYTSDVISKTHTWNISEPTCGKGQTCVVCGATGLPATGNHSYDETGICTICKDGCNHEFSVTTYKPTCIEDGYTIKECNICGYQEKYDIVSKLGHTGDIICTTCNEYIVPKSYINNLLNNIIDNKTITLTSDNIIINQNNSNMYCISINDLSITLKLNENNTLDGYGTMNLTQYYEEGEYAYTFSNKYTQQYDISFEIKDNKFYTKFSTFFDFDISSLNLNQTSYKYFFDKDGGILYYILDLDDCLNKVGLPSFNELTSILNNESICNALELLNKACKKDDSSITLLEAYILNNLFNLTTTSNGYELALDLDYIKTLFDYSINKSASELINYLIKDNLYQDLVHIVEDLNNLTIKEVIDFIEGTGLTLQDAINILNGIIPTQSEYTFEKMILQMLNVEDQSLAEYLSQPSVYNNNLFDYFKSINEEFDLSTYQSQAVEMLNSLTSQNIYTLFNIDTTSSDFESFKSTIESILDNIEFKINTNTKFEIINLSITINSNDNQNGINGNLTMSFVSDYSMSGDIINEVNNLYTVKFSPKALLEYANESGFKIINDELGEGFIVKREDSETNYYTYDSELEKTINLTEDDLVNYKDYYKTERNITYYYHVYLNDINIEIGFVNESYLFELTVNNDTSYVSYESNTREEKYSNGVLVNERTDEYSQNSNFDSITLCYTTKTGLLSLSPANYSDYFSAQLHNLVETGNRRDATTCNDLGYIEYMCSECGEIYTYYYVNGHKEVEESYEFVSDSHNCEDGVYVYGTCTECNTKYLKYISRYHSLEWCDTPKLHEGSTSCEDGADFVGICSLCGYVEIRNTIYDHYIFDYKTIDLSQYGLDGYIQFEKCQTCPYENLIQYNINNTYDYSGDYNDCTYSYLDGKFMVKVTRIRIYDMCNYTETETVKFIYNNETIYSFDKKQSGIHHTIETTNSSETVDGILTTTYTNTCNKCGKLISTSVEKTQNDLLVYSSNTNYHDDGSYYVSTYEFTYINGQRYESSSSSYDGSIEEKTIYEYDIDNCLKTQIYYRNGEYYYRDTYTCHFYINTISEATCTQSGVVQCGCGLKTEYLTPHNHNFVSNSDNTQTCSYCGISSDKYSYTNVVVEELNTTDNDLSYGYYIPFNEISLVEVYVVINDENKKLNVTSELNRIVNYGDSGYQSYYPYSSGTILINGLDSALEEYNITSEATILIQFYDTNNQLTSIYTTYTI